MAFKLTPEQQAVVDSRGGELLVSAAAGSGKTRVLVERLLSRVEQEGRNLDEFLVITFTKAAAAELRSKILSELNQRLAQEPDNRHLRRQTTLIYRAQISTIHAFCTSFLRENCHLLNLESDFRVADESEAELLRTQTLDRLLEQRYESMDEGGFGALVDALSAGRDDKKLVEITLDIHRRIQAHSDPEGWLRRQSAALRWAEGTDAGATPWGKLLLRDARRQVGYVLSRLDYALKLTELDENLYSAYSGPFTEALDNLRDFYAALDEG
jgi:ATP-dependent helicase/nuclease subunit A